MNHRKPTRLKIVQGNPGKRQLSANEPEPELGAAPPEWLSPQAIKHWPLIAQQLDEVGVLTVIDAPALGLYCEAFARWKDANEHVLKFGTVVTAPSGFPIQSPFLAIANKAHDQMVKLLIEFGMTPAARTRVEVVKKPRQGKTGLARYL
ncbi:MAG: phage terminase small subunit P27 family [Burkholderiaceae bacterium]